MYTALPQRPAMISDCVAIVKLATIMGSDIGLLNYLMSQKGFGRVV